MYGAIIGDVVGSPYEFSRNKRKDFSPLFHPKAGITDDTIMTVAQRNPSSGVHEELGSQGFTYGITRWLRKRIHEMAGSTRRSAAV